MQLKIFSTFTTLVYMLIILSSCAKTLEIKEFEINHNDCRNWIGRENDLLNTKILISRESSDSFNIMLTHRWQGTYLPQNADWKKYPTKWQNNIDSSSKNFKFYINNMNQVSIQFSQGLFPDSKYLITCADTSEYNDINFAINESNRFVLRNALLGCKSGILDPLTNSKFDFDKKYSYLNHLKQIKIKDYKSILDSIWRFEDCAR